MATIPNNPKDIIKASLDFEAEGYKILTDAAEKAVDPLSKATFTFLANQEIKHMETIKAFAASLEGTAQFDAKDLPDPITLAKAKREIGGIFAKFKADYESTAGLDDERMQVYGVAMNMECRGHDFYGQAADQAEDDTAKKIYRLLSDEEAGHYQIIQETQTFLQQPDAIMAVEERWMQI